MSDGENLQVGQAGQVGRQVGHRVVVQVEFLQQETPGQARREVCEAILGKVKSLKTGLEALQGVGQAVDAVAGEREEVEIREVEGSSQARDFPKTQCNMGGTLLPELMTGSLVIGYDI